MYNKVLSLPAGAAELRGLPAQRVKGGGIGGGWGKGDGGTEGRRDRGTEGRRDRGTEGRTEGGRSHWTDGLCDCFDSGTMLQC